MTTPLAHIYMALDGHMDYLRITSPYQGGPMIHERNKKPQDVAEKVRNVMGGGMKNGK